MRLPVDPVLVLLWSCLVALGAVVVASASLSLADDAWFYTTRHFAYLAASLVALTVMLALPLELWNMLHRVALVLAWALLLAVLLPGVGHEAKGAVRWLKVGGFTVQASELAKFLFIVYLAGYLARFQVALRSSFRALLVPVTVLLVTSGLLLAEPDFGTVVVLASVTGACLFLAGAPLGYFGLLAVAGIGALGLVAVAAPYRLERLVTFLDPWADASDSGYQLTQSLIAFGRGDLFGLGLGESVQKLFYLPEAHNDFVFAVLAEELGLLGAFAVLLLFGWLIVRMLQVARRCVTQERLFAGYLVYGAAIMLGVQFAINVGVTTGVLPTKGLTLPFVSYGGNSLVVCSALLGAVLRADAESRRG